MERRPGAQEPRAFTPAGARSREAERPVRSRQVGAWGLPAEQHGLSPPLAGSDTQVTATGLHPRPCTPSLKKLGQSPPPGKLRHTLPKRKGLSLGPWFATPGFSHTISESWLLLLFLNQLQRNSRLSHTQIVARKAETIEQN